MDKGIALEKLQGLVGRDLREIAEERSVTVWSGDKMNKGWAGHAVERYLGLPLNSSQSPNLGSWELKIVPLTASPDGVCAVKETMAITMLDPEEVLAKPFEESHLFHETPQDHRRGADARGRRGVALRLQERPCVRLGGDGAFRASQGRLRGHQARAADGGL